MNLPYEHDFSAESTINALSINLGAVYVYAFKPVKTASIVFRCDEESLIDAFSIVEKQGKLTLGWNNGNLHHDGHYLVEVHIPCQSIGAIEFTGSGVVAVHDHVLRQDINQELKISSSGSGRLLIEDENIEANGLKLSQTGPGLLQIACNDAKIQGIVKLCNTGSGTLACLMTSLSTGVVKIASTGSGNIFALTKSSINISDSMDASVTGSGCAKLNSDTISTPNLKVNIAGSGDLQITSKTQLFASNLTISIAGSGEGVVAGPGTCNNLKVSIMGSGAFHSNLIPSTGNLSIMGSGSAYLMNIGTFKQNIGGSGKARPFDSNKIHFLDDYTICLIPVPTPSKVDSHKVASISNWFKNTIFG